MKYLILAGVAISTPVQAADKWLSPTGDGVTYEKGAPTATSNLPMSSVQVAPMGRWNGRYRFNVSVVNDGASVNVGLENVTFSYCAAPVAALTMQEMQSVERNKAMWQSIAIAVVSAGAAYASSANRTSITTRGSGGFYARTVIRQPGNDGAFVALGGLGIAARQVALRRGLDEMGQEAMLTTTLQAGDTFGGFVVAPKMKGKCSVVGMDVAVGVDVHHFSFEEKK